MNRLRKLREQKGLNRKELAEKVFVHSNTILRWEKDYDLNLKYFDAKRIAEVFGITIEELHEGK